MLKTIALPSVVSLAASGRDPGLSQESDGAGVPWVATQRSSREPPRMTGRSLCEPVMRTRGSSPSDETEVQRSNAFQCDFHRFVVKGGISYSFPENVNHRKTSKSLTC